MVNKKSRNRIFVMAPSMNVSVLLLLGDLMIGNRGLMTTKSGGKVTVSVGSTSCVGSILKKGMGIWVDPFMCARLDSTFLQ